MQRGEQEATRCVSIFCIGWRFGPFFFSFLPLDETCGEPLLQSVRLMGASLHKGLCFVGFKRAKIENVKVDHGAL